MFPLLESHIRLALVLRSLLNYRRFDLAALATREYRRTEPDLRDLTGAEDRNGWWRSGAEDAHNRSSRRATGNALVWCDDFTIMGGSAPVKRRDKEDIVVGLQGV